CLVTDSSRTAFTNFLLAKVDHTATIFRAGLKRLLAVSLFPGICLPRVVQGLLHSGSATIATPFFQEMWRASLLTRWEDLVARRSDHSCSAVTNTSDKAINSSTRRRLRPHPLELTRSTIQTWRNEIL